MTEPDHDMELVERLARIHHEALSPNHSWAGLDVTVTIRPDDR